MKTRSISILIGSALVLFTACAGLAENEETRPDDPSKLFYLGNNFYEKMDYKRASDEYRKILDLGFESGNLYYNLGNAYFKLGKIGPAILYYRKAERVMPQDKDLKENLAYAKSVAGGPNFAVPDTNPALDIIKKPFKDFNLNALAISALIFYIFLAVMSSFFIMNPFYIKRLWMLYAAALIIFAVNSSALVLRYYDEEVLRRGIVVQGGVDCKYEPIDKSTTYYKLEEGQEAVILKTRGGWCQIKRLDGKIAWVKEGALEEI